MTEFGYRASSLKQPGMSPIEPADRTGQATWISAYARTVTPGVIEGIGVALTYAKR